MAPHVHQPTVLHVEDRDVNRHLRRRLLEPAGFRVIDAATMREAYAAVVEERPDVVLTDIVLPDGSGFDLTQQIRANPLTEHVRVVQISASFTDPEYRVRGLDSGADAYLIEPVDPAELIAVIRAVVRGRRTEHLLNTIVDVAPMLVTGADRCGRIVLFNPACEALTGYHRKDVVGRPFIETLVSPDDREDVARRLRDTESPAAGPPHESRWRTASGDDRLIEWRTFSVAAPDGGAWSLGIGHDVTEPRQTQNALRSSEQRLRTVIDNTTALVYVVDADCRFMLANATFASMFGFDADTIVGRSLHDLFGADTAKQFEQNNREILRTATAIEYEEVVPQADGVHTYISIKAPLLDDNGRPYAVCGVSTDITERKQLEESLKQADRRKDAFIATVAHELRQPLAPIVTALELVKRRISEEATTHAHEVIERQVRQMERLIEDLLDASRISQGKVAIRPRRVALNDVISHAVSVVRPLVRQREQDLHVHVPGEAIWLDADPDRLQQVFSNLLNNAVKFTPPQGRISLDVEPAPDAITVRVADTGRGIAPDLLPRVFDLFTQASADERGIGVGLAVVRGLVERHGGTVTAHSDGLGKGSEFVVRLPHVRSPGEVGEESAKRPTG
jgi:PAS domain S-box-containing protein